MADPVQRLLDEAAIRRTIDTYCHAVDRGHADDVAALFEDPDGTLVAMGDVFKGHAAVRQWYADYHANFRTKLEMLRHKIANVLIEFEDEDSARVVSYLDADLIVRGDDEVLEVVGRYDDHFVRAGDAWVFLQKDIIVHHGPAQLAELLSG